MPLTMKKQYLVKINTNIILSERITLITQVTDR